MAVQLSATVPAPGVADEIAGAASVVTLLDTAPDPVVVKCADALAVTPKARTAGIKARVMRVVGERLMSARSR